MKLLQSIDCYFCEAIGYGNLDKRASHRLVLEGAVQSYSEFDIDLRLNRIGLINTLSTQLTGS